MFYKFTAALILGTILTACSGSDSAVKTGTDSASNLGASAKNVMETKTKAVLIYADWCGSCKVLDPKIEAARAMGSVPGLEFVTLDYTDKDADAFYAQAEAAGVGDAVRSYLDGTIKTGQLLLVDVDDKAVIDVVKKTLDPAQIMIAFKDAAARS